MENKNIIKNDMQPIDDGGRKYNIIYVICGIIGGIIGIACAGIGIIFFLPLGLFVGWLIKNKILSIQALKLRDYTFKCYNVLPFPDLMNLIIPELTKMNMLVELNRDGSPIITHNNIIYDFSYNEDMTFSIWWRKNIARAFLGVNDIKSYQNISADMGIISYYIQNATKSPEDRNLNMGNVSPQDAIPQFIPPNHTSTQQVMAPQQGASVQNGEASQNEVYKYCPSCGTKYIEGPKFCQNCGTKL